DPLKLCFRSKHLEVRYCKDKLENPISLRPAKASNQLDRIRLCATGSEDTIIRIFKYEETSIPGPKGDIFATHGLECLGSFKKHTTGIQHLQWSSCGTYLFSSAGMEEFF